MKPESVEYFYVREAIGLERLIEHIGAAERVALDTEADSLHNYFEKVCLIQLSLGREHYVIDPLSGLDLRQIFGRAGGKTIDLARRRL